MKGKLKHWNEDKGFGFISSTEAQDIFIHISALKKMSRRPIVGDIITFQVHTDNNGKKRAINAQIYGVMSVNTQTKYNEKKLEPKQNDSWPIVFVIALVVIGFGIYLHFSKIVKNNFICSGKIYCSQMTSCNEAKYYLKNCLGTKMDGDNDGVPCERQWCN